MDFVFNDERKEQKKRKIKFGGQVVQSISDWNEIEKKKYYYCIQESSIHLFFYFTIQSFHCTQSLEMNCAITIILFIQSFLSYDLLCEKNSALYSHSVQWKWEKVNAFIWDGVITLIIFRIVTTMISTWYANQIPNGLYHHNFLIEKHWHLNFQFKHKRKKKVSFMQFVF